VIGLVLRVNEARTELQVSG